MHPVWQNIDAHCITSFFYFLSDLRDQTQLREIIFFQRSVDSEVEFRGILLIGVKHLSSQSKTTVKMKINTLWAMFSMMSGFIFTFVLTQLPKALAQQLQARHSLWSLLYFSVQFFHWITRFWIWYLSGNISRPVSLQQFWQKAAISSKSHEYDSLLCE